MLPFIPSDLHSINPYGHGVAEGLPANEAVAASNTVSTGGYHVIAHQMFPMQVQGFPLISQARWRTPA